MKLGGLRSVIRRYTVTHYLRTLYELIWHSAGGSVTLEVSLLLLSVKRGEEVRVRVGGVQHYSFFMMITL